VVIVVLKLRKMMKEFFNSKKDSQQDVNDSSVELEELYGLEVLLQCLKKCEEDGINGIIRTDYSHAVVEYEKGNDTISSFNLVYSRNHNDIYKCDERERKREWIIFK
jgi:hypothetical protein